MLLKSSPTSSWCCSTICFLFLGSSPAFLRSFCRLADSVGKACCIGGCSDARLLSDVLAVAGIRVTLLGVIGGGLWVIDGSKETLRIAVDKV